MIDKDDNKSVAKKGKKYQVQFKYTDDDKDTFTIHVRCGNCWHEYEIRVNKGTVVNQSHLKFLKCRFCDVQGKLFRVGWNGVVYVRLESLK